MKTNLDMELMGDDHFERWKKSFLEGKVLTLEALTSIKLAFDLDPRTTRTVSISCNEAHAHSYSCLRFGNKYSAVVFRLIEEIKDYQKKFDRIREESDYSK